MFVGCPGGGAAAAPLKATFDHACRLPQLMAAQPSWAAGIRRLLRRHITALATHGSHVQICCATSAISSEADGLAAAAELAGAKLLAAAGADNWTSSQSVDGTHNQRLSLNVPVPAQREVRLVFAGQAGFSNPRPVYDLRVQHLPNN